MAQIEKFHNKDILMLLKHSERQLKNDSNKQINESKKELNYSIPIDTNNLSPRDYYRQLIDDSYLYGRGTKRETEAITACSWIITLPKEISDYSNIKQDACIRLNPTDEEAFFQGAFDFVSERYPGCVFFNKVHYDEGGQPHIHIYFVPRLELDHQQVHYKTTKTHKAVKTASGRYQYEYNFKFENGEKIPLKNYAKISDHYNYKISGADILNKAELKHFHNDFATYLHQKGLPGADYVYTNKTGEKNLSVKALKEFTKATGVTIDELEQHPIEQTKLTELLQTAQMKPIERQIIQSINKDTIIKDLHTEISAAKEVIKSKDIELRLEKQKYEELKLKQQINITKENTWGVNANWGDSSGWNDKTHTITIGDE